MQKIAFMLHGLVRHADGPGYAAAVAFGAVQAVPGPPDLLRPGETYLIEGPGVTLEDRLFYRGPAQQNGVPIGFVLADAQGGALLLAVTAPDAAPVLLGPRQEPWSGFLTGTEIATDQGEAPIEIVAAGARVLTETGELVAVARVERRLACPLVHDPVLAAPIRVAAGALGPLRPARDLVVSPDQALLIDGTLVQAGALVGAHGVGREAFNAGVTVYYRLELTREACILAENMPADCRRAPGPSDTPDLDYPRAMSSRQLPAALRRRFLDARPRAG